MLNKRGWRKWPYWLKGGIIAEIIFIPIVFVGMLLGKFLGINMGSVGDILSVIIAITALPAFLIGLPLLVALPNLLAEIILWILILINYFLIGALIGYIYGKIKSRRQNSNAYPFSKINPY